MNKPNIFAPPKEKEVTIRIPQECKRFTVSYLSSAGLKVKKAINFFAERENIQRAKQVSNAILSDLHNNCKNIIVFKKEGLAKAILWSVMSETKKCMDGVNQNEKKRKKTKRY